MRIIGICGILDSAQLKNPKKGMTPMWKNLRTASRYAFPGSTFSTTRCWYWHLGLWKAKKYCDRILRMYDTGEDVILVGHSVGGLLACRLAGRFKKSRVVGVVTINTPFHFHYALFPYLFGGRKKLHVPVVSFGGTRDWLVPWGTKHPQAIVHTMFDADHQEDLKVNKNGMVNKIFKIVKEVFGGPA